MGWWPGGINFLMSILGSILAYILCMKEDSLFLTVKLLVGSNFMVFSCFEFMDLVGIEY